jgi:hypothetical protein
MWAVAIFKVNVDCHVHIMGLFKLHMQEVWLGKGLLLQHSFPLPSCGWAWYEGLLYCGGDNK